MAGYEEPKIIAYPDMHPHNYIIGNEIVALIGIDIFTPLTFPVKGYIITIRLYRLTISR